MGIKGKKWCSLFIETSRPEFPISGDVGASSLLVQGGNLSLGSFTSCFQGRRQLVGSSGWPPCSCPFPKILQLKILNLSMHYIWGWLGQTPHQYMKYYDNWVFLGVDNFCQCITPVTLNSFALKSHFSWYSTCPFWLLTMCVFLVTLTSSPWSVPLCYFTGVLWMT